MNRICLGIMAGLLLGGGILPPNPPLLPEKDVRVLANELSGELAKRNLEVIATAHRQRGSRGFHAAAEFVTERLRAYGLSDLEILQFPADGKIFYGTQRSRPPWDAEVGELSELRHVGLPPKDRRVPAEREQPIRLCDYASEPVVLAEDSESADVASPRVIDVEDAFIGRE
ncbi:MAG: hypothetical protein HRJ53_01475, partial [Acidobacteria bacterium Pan2503]|nr:hypothetical protein [Candidatus Acidoferrum panamensis]